MTKRKRYVLARKRAKVVVGWHLLNVQDAAKRGDARLKRALMTAIIDGIMGVHDA
jgi:hypothetical protein